MWNEGDPRSDLRGHEVAMGRAGSSVVVMDERVMEAASRAQPGVTKINVTKSSRLHIGPKFVSVTQNVDNSEVVKGEPLITRTSTMRSRPSALCLPSLGRAAVLRAHTARCDYVHIHTLRYLHISELAHIHIIYIGTTLL